MSGGEQPQRAERSGRRRDKHRADAHFLREVYRVERPRAAVCDEREVGRIVSLFNRDDADGARHVGIYYLYYSERSLFRADAHRVGYLFLDGLLGELGVYLEPASEDVMGIDASEDEVRVGDYGVLVAEP